MNGSFAGAARKLAGVAARILGWRPADFWDSTPAELAGSLETGCTPASPPGRAEIRALIERDRDNG